LIHLGRDVFVKKNALSDIRCQSLIEIFENDNTQKSVNDSSGQGKKYVEGTSYTDVNLTSVNGPKLKSFIHDMIIDVVKEYCEKLGIPFLGDKYEAPELMKFVVGQDKFDTHFDANGSDHSRVLAIIWYLNDVSDGGELHLPSKTEPLIIKPELGKLVVVPADWTHYHFITTPKSNDRYSMIAFIRYN
jgi:hypothetical protein